MARKTKHSYDVAEIERLLNEGYSEGKIADKFGISRQVFNGYLRRNFIKKVTVALIKRD